MTREDSLVWLQTRFSSLYLRVSLDTEDVPEGFAPVLDSAWTLLGADPGTEIPQSRSTQWEAALEFHALKRVALEYVQKYSKAFAGMSLQTYQVFQGINKMLEAASRRLVTVGLASAEGVGPMIDASYDDIVIKPRRTIPRVAYLGGATEYG